MLCSAGNSLVSFLAHGDPKQDPHQVLSNISFTSDSCDQMPSPVWGMRPASPKQDNQGQTLGGGLGVASVGSRLSPSYPQLPNKGADLGAPSKLIPGLPKYVVDCTPAQLTSI